MPRSAETSIAKADITGSIRSLENIHMDGSGVLSFVESTVPPQVRAILERNGLTIDDIDLVIFHQASKVTLDSLCRSLDVPSEKAFSNLRDIGNTVSASIPIAIRDATDQGRLRPGDRVLLCGLRGGDVVGDGHPSDLNAGDHRGNDVEFLFERFEAVPGSKAFIDRGRPFSYGELMELTQRFGERLRTGGRRRLETSSWCSATTRPRSSACSSR